jgi:hypothetical protein
MLLPCTNRGCLSRRYHLVDTGPSPLPFLPSRSPGSGHKFIVGSLILARPDG